MKIYRNLEEIQRKEQLGRRFSTIGLLVLFSGLMSSFVPSCYPPDQPAITPFGQLVQANWVYVSFVALPLGFICASMGSYFINRFARRRWPGIKQIARPDELIARSLKGLDNKYALFLWSLPANYILVGPCGVLLFSPRGDKGRVRVQGDTWREPFSIGRFFSIFAREGVGNPPREIADQIQSLRKLLQEADRENTDENESLADVAMDGAAIFLNQQMEIEAESPSIPALRLDQVKPYVRRKTQEVKLRTSVLRRLTRVLEENSDFTEEE